ncbi:MAG: PP2C family serine/threonine-protein phosphatase [Chloroflexota bacterium]
MNNNPAIDPTDEADAQSPQSQPSPQLAQLPPVESPEDSLQESLLEADTPPLDDMPPPDAAPEGVEAAEVAAAAEPAAPAEVSLGKITTPLAEAGGPPAPPIAEGTVLNERYQIATLLGVVRDTNMYRVTDLQGYRRCWACGSDSSMPGDIYCVECGAQLAGRFYRLQEFNLLPNEPIADTADSAEALVRARQSALKIVPAILENRVMGVAHVYDIWVEEDAQRVYLAWEEASGRVMSSWLPGARATDELLAKQSGHLAVPQEPEEEQVLAWLVQAADLLARLHDEGIAGCAMELGNLLVQPGDRLLLLDPSGCVTTDGMGMEERDALELSDVRALAAELEKWYMAVRKDAPPEEDGDGSSGDTADAESPVLPMVSAYEVTGPLGRNMNTSVALARAREGSYPTAHAFSEVLRDFYEASKPLTNLKLWSGRTSDVGRVRKINEDSVLTLEATVLEHDGNLPVALYVVADGMGGHQSGEVASSIAARTIGSVVNSSLIAPLVSGDPVARDVNTCGLLLQHAILEANRRITDLARERHSDLGTTAVVALLIGNQLTVANVGDSRAYLWHDNTLQVITRDHSLVMQLVVAGQIKPDDIYTHPRRNEIYRALGDSRLTEEEIDIYSHRLRPGDGVMLCSDGLWDFVRDPDIAAILASPGDDPQTISSALVDRANMNGGEDNISVILARVMSSET